MRLQEFTAPTDSKPESNLVTALELLRNRYKDRGQAPQISTQALINLVLNTDKNFNYDALVAANKNNPAIQNLIKKFDQETVTLRSADDQTDDITTNVDVDPEAPTDTVDSMAKRAAKQRGAAIA